MEDEILINFEINCSYLIVSAPFSRLVDVCESCEMTENDPVVKIAEENNNAFHVGGVTVTDNSDNSTSNDSDGEESLHANDDNVEDSCGSSDVVPSDKDENDVIHYFMKSTSHEVGLFVFLFMGGYECGLTGVILLV